jgi:hypothetical protein
MHLTAVAEALERLSLSVAIRALAVASTDVLATLTESPVGGPTRLWTLATPRPQAVSCALSCAATGGGYSDDTDMVNSQNMMKHKAPVIGSPPCRGGVQAFGGR